MINQDNSTKHERKINVLQKMKRIFNMKRLVDRRKPIALDIARTPSTLAPFQFMTLPPCPSILISSSLLSG
jgi:hypothetical protein